MAQQLILVNGMPASGKSTPARALGSQFGVPAVSKDALKEPPADITGATVGSTELGALASDTNVAAGGGGPQVGHCGSLVVWPPGPGSRETGTHCGGGALNS